MQNRAMLCILPVAAIILAVGSGCEKQPSDAEADDQHLTETPLSAPTNRRIQIVGDQFYLDGVLLLIKASFYEYHPVGTEPWKVKPPKNVLRRQLRDLKAAGFNTLRSFNFTPETIRICDEEGMLVFVQYWIDQAGNFRDNTFREENIARIRKLTQQFCDFDNVIGYLVMNEPHVHTATTQTEIDAVMSHLVELRNVIKEVDPGAYVSLADWPPLVDLDHSMWDFVCFNVYTWSPITTSDSGMGYRPFVEFLKKTHAKDKPLVIMEYGVSVAPTDLSGHGYGGWSEEGQARESLRMLRDLLAAGSAGGTYTHFADQIWKEGSIHDQEDHPEEWFGMYELDPGGGPAMEGRWRPVYDAHKAFYRAVLLEPPPAATITGGQRILVHAEAAYSVDYRVDHGDWHRLRKDPAPWWTARLNTHELEDGLHHIEIAIIGPWENRKYRHAWCIVANKKPDPYALTVMVTPSARSVECGEALTATIRVTHADGTPAAGQDVNWGVHENWNWEISPMQAVTGPDGSTKVSIPTHRGAGMVTISAGVQVSEKHYRRRFGDLAVVRVGME